jgi:hypothetical protein
LLWVRVAFDLGGLRYMVVVHRFGLAKPRLVVFLKGGWGTLVRAPSKEVWRRN